MKFLGGYGWLVLALILYALFVVNLHSCMTSIDRAHDLTKAHERGWCAGVCENQGLIPAWDEDEQCVCGMFPATEVYEENE